MLKNELRPDWQDSSLALKISYGPSRNPISQGIINEEKIVGNERKRETLSGTIYMIEINLF